MDTQKDKEKNSLNTGDSVSDKFFYIGRKLERVVMAIYMVTDVMEDGEPVKGTLRTLAIELVTIHHDDAQDGGQSSPEVLYGDMRAATEKIESFVRIARTVGLMSEMNGTILEQEISNIRALYRDFMNASVSPFGMIALSSGNKDRVILRGEFFDVPTQEKSAEPATFGDQKKNILASKTVQKDNTLKRTDNPIKDKIDRNERREKIISIVRNKGQVSIKDIALEFTDCSEKTIQRELISLVSSGVLNKNGKKRWSTYSINTIDK